MENNLKRKKYVYKKRIKSAQLILKRNLTWKMITEKGE